MATILLMGLAALFGAAGVAGGAYAAHGPEPRLVGLAAAGAFAHAPALLALALGAKPGARWPLVPGLMWTLGILLFSGDLAVRAATGERLFAAAAPAGGLCLIAGWASLAPLALLAVRKS